MTQPPDITRRIDVGDIVAISYIYPSGQHQSFIGKVLHVPSDTGDMWHILMVREMGEPEWDTPIMTSINPSCSWLQLIERTSPA